jgi:hypothetical protein
MDNISRYRYSFFFIFNKSSCTLFIGYSTSVFIYIINRRYSIFCCIVSPLLYHHKSISAAVVLSFISAPVVRLILLPFFLFFCILRHIYMYVYVDVCVIVSLSHIIHFMCTHIYLYR